MSHSVNERLFSRFFRLKIGDDVRAFLTPELEHIRDTKLRRVQKVGSNHCCRRHDSSSHLGLTEIVGCK